MKNTWNKSALIVALATTLVIPSFSAVAHAASDNAQAPVTKKITATAPTTKVQHINPTTLAEKERILANNGIPKERLPEDPRGPMPNSPAEWDEWVKKHPDPVVDNKVYAPDGSVVAGVTTKYIPFNLISHGNLIFGAGAASSSGSSAPYGYFRHASMYNANDGKFVSANVSDIPDQNGVCRELKSKWQHGYNDVSINKVPKATWGQLNSVVQNALYHLGEPYKWYSSKTDTKNWYCSKLIWFEYNKWASLDLDSNGGYWVTPDDLYYSNYVSQFWRG